MRQTTNTYNGAQNIFLNVKGNLYE